MGSQKKLEGKALITWGREVLVYKTSDKEFCMLLRTKTELQMISMTLMLMHLLAPGFDTCLTFGKLGEQMLMILVQDVH